MQILLLILLIFYVSDCCSQQLEDDQLLSQGKCPLWFQYNETLHRCQCPQGTLYADLLTCEGKDAIMISSSIATYDENKKIITLSPNHCKLFNETIEQPGYVLLPRNLSRLNEYMCGPLNRKGYLCKDCVNGYGLAITTVRCSNKCFKCAAQTLVNR